MRATKENQGFLRLTAPQMSLGTSLWAPWSSAAGAGQRRFRLFERSRNGGFHPRGTPKMDQNGWFIMKNPMKIRLI